MDINKTLISTALLTAIFEKTKKGNIELISPFVLYIISESNSPSDSDYIKAKIESDFSFLNFPHAVLNIIINKLKKDGKIEQKDNKYFILSKSKREVEDFKKRMNSAETEAKEVMNALIDYLKNNTSIKINYNNVKTALASFLDKNGYIIYNNFEPSKLKVKNGDRLQFFIGKFIENEYNLSSDIFKLLINIIEGLLLSNVIYLQIDINSTTNLEKLNCYFDSPFLLRLIEFKTNEDNVSANELVELLKKQGAKIKCFRHSFDEVQAILRNYIDNRSFRSNGKTLEALDFEDYNDVELNEIYLNLENIFEQYGIVIEDKPDYKKEKYKNNKYEDVIDEKKLREILLSRYSDKNIKDKVIDNDIDSVSAIVRLRKGKKVQKLEDCNSIFVTSNYDIRTSVRTLLNIDEKIEISPVIGDIDLTAIVWLRALKDNSNLPKDKLIENARAAMKPSLAIIEEFNRSLEKIKKTKYVKDGNSLQALIYTTHFSSQFMDEIEGDASNIKPSTIVNLYEKSLEDARIISSQNKDEKNKNRKLQAKNDELAKKLVEIKQKNDIVIKNINRKYDEKIEKHSKTISQLFKVLIDILIFLFLIISVYFTTISREDYGKYKFFYIISSIVSLYCLISSFIKLPYFFSFSKLIKKYVYTKISPIISKYYRRKQKKELDELFKNIDKGVNKYD